MGLFSKMNENKNAEYEKRKNFEEENTQYGKQIRTEKAQYFGGHPDAAVGMPMFGHISIYEKCITFLDIKTPITYKMIGFRIPLENIINVEYKNETDIEKDVTLTRLLVLGIFAFGAKKKKVEKHDYLIVTYNENGIENKIIFEPSHCSPSALVSEILKLRSNIEIVNIRDKDNNEDITDKIRKLSALKDEGILTEEEFNNKKKELLSKI